MYPPAPEKIMPERAAGSTATEYSNAVFEEGGGGGGGVTIFFFVTRHTIANSAILIDA